MSNIEFDNFDSNFKPKKQISSQPKNSKMVSFLLKIGITKNEKYAEYVLLGTAAFSFLIMFYVISYYLLDVRIRRPNVNNLKNLSTEERAALPPQVLIDIEKNQ